MSDAAARFRVVVLPAGLVFEASAQQPLLQSAR